MSEVDTAVAAYTLAVNPLLVTVTPGTTTLDQAPSPPCREVLWDIEAKEIGGSGTSYTTIFTVKVDAAGSSIDYFEDSLLTTPATDLYFTASLSGGRISLVAHSTAASWKIAFVQRSALP